MTEINFPNSPQVNDTFTVGERTWKWTGLAWDVVVTTVVTGPQGIQGEQGIQGIQGIQGLKGDKGDAGAGIATGGATGQILVKNSGSDYDTKWANNQTVSYNHTQNAVSYNWVVNHNLGFYPSVVVKDSAGTVIEGDIVYTDVNNLTINLSSAISGYAYLS